METKYTKVNTMRSAEKSALMYAVGPVYTASLLDERSSAGE